MSEKGYMGEAQTRRFSQYSSVNILEGAETLRDKLGLSRGDIFEALARYKGGKDKKDAQQQAREVFEALPFRGTQKEGDREADKGSRRCHGPCLDGTSPIVASALTNRPRIRKI